jgi:mono/diheme cytochrome c family protein/cytochrome c553
VNRILQVTAAAVIVAFAGFMFLSSPLAWEATHAEGDHPDTAVADIENGKTLFRMSGCAVCHMSAGGSDETRLGGGRALETTFGTFYMPNISPDPVDGIGNWSTAQLIHVAREGVAPDGKNQYPAFPYTSYRHMTANDLRDLFAYLKTLPPVAGKARAHDLKFPFSMRRGVGLWKLAFLDDKPLKSEPAKSAEWSRGRYLVEGAGHCAECHSPRTSMGSIASGKRYAGGLDAQRKGYVPNVTQDETGIGYWSRNEIASYLKDGASPTGIKAGGEMAAVIGNTARLTSADRQAMATYLKSLPGVASLNAGRPALNTTAVIRILPKDDDKARRSSLAALATPPDNMAQASVVYVVATKPFTLERPAPGAAPGGDGRLLAMTKLAVVARDGDLLQVRIDGWQQAGSESALYALRGQRILQALLSPGAVAKVSRARTSHDADTGLDWYSGSLKVWITRDALSLDLERLQQYASELHAASCATCHALQPAQTYLANQWVGNLAAMKRFTSLDDGQYRLLLTYLQYHSKDVGAVKVAAEP